jgi:hypothetical protein
MNSRTAGILGWWREAVGAVIVLVSRILTAPRTPWENDEFLFAEAVRKFAPSLYHPHPPGYPLYVFLGKIVNIFTNDPWRALVILGIIAAPVGFVALARAFRHWIDDADLAVAAALVYYFSASMLVHGTLALSDGPSIAFLALALLALSNLNDPSHERSALALGVWSSAAIGCRPQLVVPMLPLLAVALWQMRTMRQRIACAGAFVFVSLMWFLVLVDATGGFQNLIAYETKQAQYFASHDAAMSRGSKSVAEIAIRFLLHPWGSKYVTIPLLLAVALGLPFLWRLRRMLLPLFVFSVVQAIFELGWMDPADGARYSLPLMIVFALAAGCGFAVVRRSAHVRAIPWIAAGAVAVLSIWYARPILASRTRRPSPVFDAASFANQHFAPDTIVLYDPSMRPHAEYLMSRFRTAPVEKALANFYDRPDVPLVLFADGGSHAPDARVFAWPDSDAYGKLTRNRYRVVTLEPVPPAERYLPLPGVYALERTVAGDSWRWLARDAAIRLPAAHLPHVAVSLRLSPDAPYDWTAVTVNGARLVVTKQAATITIPATRDIAFHSDQSFAPATVLHNQDPRTLAVQLIRVVQSP